MTSRRQRFDLGPVGEFTIAYNGQRYGFSECRVLARKGRIATNIWEHVLETPIETKVLLTVVGDEDQTDATGIRRGWYVVEELREEEAATLIKIMVSHCS